MGRIVATHTDIVLTLDYQCAHCGLETQANVMGFGRGLGSSLQAAEDHEAMAREHAEENARDTLKFAGCPRCGETAPEAPALKRKKQRQPFIMAIGLLAVFLPIGLIGIMAFWKWTLLMTGIVGFIVFQNERGEPQPWQDTAERVRFAKNERPAKRRRRVGRRSLRRRAS